ASSSFQHNRDVRLATGQTAQVGDYRFTYVKPTARLVAAPNGRLERIDLGAVLTVRKGRGTPRTLATYKSYFPSAGPLLGPLSRFFEGDATSEVGLQAGLTKDIWSAIQPDTSRLQLRVAEGDRVFERAKALTAGQRDQFLAEALRALARSYAAAPPPATFR